MGSHHLRCIPLPIKFHLCLWDASFNQMLVCLSARVADLVECDVNKITNLFDETLMKFMYQLVILTNRTACINNLSAPL